MEGFEKDKWEIRVLHNGFKIVKHKDFPFIRFYVKKIQKSFEYRNPVWEVTLRRWSSTYNSPNLTVSYKKLTKNKMAEIFEQLMKRDLTKAIIFEYLFNGKY